MGRGSKLEHGEGACIEDRECVLNGRVHYSWWDILLECVSSHFPYLIYKQYLQTFYPSVGHSCVLMLPNKSHTIGGFYRKYSIASMSQDAQEAEQNCSIPQPTFLRRTHNRTGAIKQYRFSPITINPTTEMNWPSARNTALPSSHCPPWYSACSVLPSYPSGPE